MCSGVPRKLRESISVGMWLYALFRVHETPKHSVQYPYRSYSIYLSKKEAFCAMCPHVHINSVLWNNCKCRRQKQNKTGNYYIHTQHTQGQDTCRKHLNREMLHTTYIMPFRAFTFLAAICFCYCHCCTILLLLRLLFAICVLPIWLLLSLVMFRCWCLTLIMIYVLYYATVFK